MKTKTKTTVIVNGDKKVSKKNTATDKPIGEYRNKLTPSALKVAETAAVKDVSKLESVAQKHKAFRTIAEKGFVAQTPKDFYMLLLCEKSISRSRERLTAVNAKYKSENGELLETVKDLKESLKEQSETIIVSPAKDLSATKTETESLGVTNLEINKRHLDNIPDIDEVESYLVDPSHKLKWGRLLEKGRVIDREKAFFIRQVLINRLANEDLINDSYQDRAEFNSRIVVNPSSSDLLWLV